VWALVFAGAAIAVDRVGASLRHRIEQERLLLATAIAGEIDATMGHATASLQQLATLSSPPTSAESASLLDFSVTHSAVFTEGIAITDAGYRVVAADHQHQALVGTSLDGPWSGPATGEGPITRGLKLGTTTSPLVALAVPLAANPDGGYVVGLMDARTAYPSQVLARAIRLGGTGHADLVDNAEVALFSTEPGLLLVSSDHPSAYQRWRQEGGSGVGLAAHEEHSAHPDEDHLMGFVQLRNVPWALAIGTGASEAYAPARQISQGALGVLAALAAIALLVTVFVGRKLVEPVRALSHVAQRVAGGERHLPIQGGWGGEIGDLATSLESMRRELAGWGTELEQRVRTRTQELSATAAVSEAAASSLVTDQVLERAVDTLYKTLKADAAVAYLIDNSGGGVKLWADRGFPPGFFDATRPGNCSGCPAAQAVQEGRTLTLAATDLSEAERPRCLQADFREVLTSPIGTPQRTLGAVCLLARREGSLGSAQRVLEVVRYQLGTSLDNAALYETLRERGEHLKKVLAKVLSAQEEERRRVSLELHDVIGQALTALAMGLERLGQSRAEEWPKLHAEIDALHRLSTDTLADLRRLSLALRPSALDDLGLVPAIRRYADQYLGTAGVAVRITAEGSDARMDPSTEVVVFRVVQEAVNNIARHSRATKATVAIAHSDDSVVAIVEDNGIGFDSTRVSSNGSSGGLGLVGMLERAELVGGTLSITSKPGHGTTVRLEIPLAVQVQR